MENILFPTGSPTALTTLHPHRIILGTATNLNIFKFLRLPVLLSQCAQQLGLSFLTLHTLAGISVNLALATARLFLDQMI